MENVSGIRLAIKGIVEELSASGEYGERFHALAETLIAQNGEKSRAAMAALGVGGNCRITGYRWWCEESGLDGGPGIQYARKPINTGPTQRPPIGWGGEECVTIGRCTFCYTYECRPDVVK